MKNGERIMYDVASIVREYEAGRVKAEPAIRKINELTEQNCDHCAYLGNCTRDSHHTCYNGFMQYLVNEA